MQRVKIIKPNKKYAIGQVIELSNNEAFGLIDSGVAEQTKHLEARDYKIKGIKHG